MRSLICLIILLLVGCGCFERNQVSLTKIKEDTLSRKTLIKKVSHLESMITECDTIPLQFLSVSKKNRFLVTFKKHTYVYCSPSIKSVIIDTLKFNSELKSKRSLIRIKRNKKNRIQIENSFYEINISGKKGYVLNRGFALQKLGNSILLGTNDKGMFKILSINKENQIIDSLELKSHYNNHYIKFTEKTALNFNKKIICFKTYRGSCPGGGNLDFISIDNKGRLKKMISSYYNTMENSDVFFPTKLEDNTIGFRKNGELNYIKKLPVDDSYLNNLKIPIEQLIIEAKTVYKGDIEGLSEDEIEVASFTVNIYKWDNNRLNKIKTLKK